MLQNSLVFICGSVLYPLIEISWRGHTHSSMSLAGGICMVLINLICCNKMQKKSLAAKCATGSLIITSIEFAAGLAVNKALCLNVWDYSALPFNILGQICLPFSAVWFIMTIPALYLCRLCNTLCGRLLYDTDVGIKTAP